MLMHNMSLILKNLWNLSCYAYAGLFSCEVHEIHCIMSCSKKRKTKLKHQALYDWLACASSSIINHSSVSVTLLHTVSSIEECM